MELIETQDLRMLSISRPTKRRSMLLAEMREAATSTTPWLQVRKSKIRVELDVMLTHSSGQWCGGDHRQ
jgi:hypothetical protein